MADAGQVRGDRNPEPFRPAASSPMPDCISTFGVLMAPKERTTSAPRQFSVFAVGLRSSTPLARLPSKGQSGDQARSSTVRLGRSSKGIDISAEDGQALAVGMRQLKMDGARALHHHAVDAVEARDADRSAHLPPVARRRGERGSGAVCNKDRAALFHDRTGSGPPCQSSIRR